jgi:adenosylcobyric acid synthase
MLLGTASHVGKSLLTVALCRILAQDGKRVAPFKAQNMSLNSAATPDGREIGRAQALQAEAAGIAPSVEMNPILLKPMSDRRSQLVLLGRIWGNVDAYDYHRRRVDTFFPTVVDAYRRLASAHDIIILEGAGSPAEINLKDTDIVNLRMAQAADAQCVLVGDIDRGGVFASLLGTLELLTPHERARIKAFIINKFRGDRSLLEDGIAHIEKRLGIPCAGVVPWIEHIDLDEEDSVAIEEQPRAAHFPRREHRDPTRPLRVVVTALPHLANFTDFDALATEPNVELGYAHTAAELGDADLIIIPGSKATLADLAWMRENGTAQAIEDSDALILGICGGMQILGEHISDPTGIEGGGNASGLRLLPIDTVLRSEKRTNLIRGHFASSTLFGEHLDEAEIHGYEIHVGDTRTVASTRPLLRIQRIGINREEHITDGAIAANGRVAGTYVHGLLAEDAPRHALLRAARAATGLTPATQFADIAAQRTMRLDRLATHVRASLDMSLLGFSVNASTRRDVAH